MKQVRILLVDDHAVLRSGLRMLLEAQADLEVVGEAGDGETAVALAGELQPDVVLLDLTLPGMSGIEAARRIRAAAPAAKIIVLTMHDDRGYLAEALKAGVSGYVLKKAADTELLSAIRAVHASNVLVFSGVTLGGPAEAPSKAPAAPAPSGALNALSEREREVLRLIALGYTNQEIGNRLYLSVKTVETYKTRLMEKLQMKRRSELVRFALEQGLVQLEQ